MLFPSILWVKNLDRFLLLHVVSPGITHSAASQLINRLIWTVQEAFTQLSGALLRIYLSSPHSWLGLPHSMVVSRYLDFLHGHWLSHSRNESCCAPWRLGQKIAQDHVHHHGLSGFAILVALYVFIGFEDTGILCYCYYLPSSFPPGTFTCLADDYKAG